MAAKGIGLVLWMGLFSVVLSSCHKDENVQLRKEVDSLKWVLESSQNVEFQLNEIDDLLDSIDANRKILRATVVQDPEYRGYANRLRDLNFHIRDTQLKIEELEQASSKVKELLIAVQTLQTELALQADQFSALQKKGKLHRGEMDSMKRVVTHRDSLLNTREEVIKIKEADIAALETLIRENEENVKREMSELYYAQAEALEIAADRTNFAPQRKKETLREAIELYKISLSLGKVEAQEKIEVLEKKLS